jgi:PST family polysaccharide transporter
VSTPAHSLAAVTDAGALREGLKESTVRGGIVSVASEAVDFFLRLGSLVLLARMLTPEDFGLVSMVTAITGFAVYFKDFGLASAVVQSPDVTRPQLDTLFWVNAAAGLVTAALIVAVAGPIAAFFQEGRLVAITLAMATTFVWSGLANQHQALLRRGMCFGRIAAVQLTASLLSIVLAATMAASGYGYWALVWREVSRTVFMTIGAWIAFPWVPGRPVPGAGVGRFVRFGAYVTGPNVMSLLTSSLDHVIVGRFFGAQQLGFYRQGVQLVLAPMNQLLFPVRSVAEAALSRLQGDADAYRRYYRSILCALALPTVPLGLFFAVLAAEIVSEVLGPQWMGAVPVLRILGIAAFLRPALATSGGVMVTCGHSKRFFWQGATAGAGLVLFYFLGIPFGPSGVASAHVWALCAIALPQLYWAFKGTPVSVRFFFESIKRPCVSGAVMTGVLLAMKAGLATQGHFVVLLAGLACAPMAYFGTWLALSGGRDELVRVVRDLARPLRPLRALGMLRRLSGVTS